MITYSAVKGLAVWVFLAILGFTTPASFAGDYNSLVLEQIGQMPQGGRYSVSHFAKIRLQSSAHFESGKFFILPSQASPSFCSGATYLVFIRTIEALRARGQLQLDYSTLERLIIRDQRDGEGIWGRWNANGPGTARLFHELQLGQNFDNFRSGETWRFHENLLVAAGREKRAWAFHDFPRHGESSGRPVCPLLVEQRSVWLRRKERSAKQDRLRHFFTSSDACQSRADQQRSIRRYVFGVSRSNSLQHCGSRREVRALNRAQESHHKVDLLLRRRCGKSK